ncbi:MAG: hypothetical protein AAF732_06565 [Pseudomonadota bacterium]
MGDVAFYTLAQLSDETTRTPAAPPAATAVSEALATVGPSQPNAWVLVGLAYIAIGVLAALAVYIGGCQWHGSAPGRRAWAAKHQIHGMSFTALVFLLGLAGLAVAQFRSDAISPTLPFGLLALPVLGVLYVFTIDLFELNDGLGDRDGYAALGVAATAGPMLVADAAPPVANGDLAYAHAVPATSEPANVSSAAPATGEPPVSAPVAEN